MYRIARIALLFLALLGTGSCLVFSNRAFFNELNKRDDRTPPCRPENAKRVSWIVRSAVIDSYYEKEKVAGYLDALSKAEEMGGPLSELYDCRFRATRSPKRQSQATDRCHETFFRKVFEMIPGSGGYILDGEDPKRPLEAERDLVRLVSNLANAGEDLHVLASQRRRFGSEEDKCDSSTKDSRTAADPLAVDLRPGVIAGLEEAAMVIEKRKWYRHLEKGRKPTALVMSGGAADGAFAAGFVWALLASYLETDQPNLDLIVGTSTGALIGAVVDSFFTKPDATEPQRIARGTARDFLLTAYTHSYQRDLLCIVPGWGALGMFAGSARGLVRFDPLERTLSQRVVSKHSIENSTEFVTMSVDLTQGILWPHSDQDPDGMSVEKRVWTVLASVVEPALAEPKLRAALADFPEGIPEGMYIDGGVRSGLPLVEAVRRGAERVVAFSASGIDSVPVPPRKNGGQILFRSIDLFVDQLRVAEVQQAEGQAIARRVAERELCVNRYKNPKKKDERRFICGLPEEPPPEITFAGPAPTTWTRGRPIREVDDTWRSMWVFRGENAGASSTNYGFDPRQMIPLFRSGVAEFKARCRETLETLDFESAVNSQCEESRLNRLIEDANERTREPAGGWPEKPPQPDDCVR